MKHIFFSEIGAQLQPDDLLVLVESSRCLKSINLGFGRYSERSVLVTSDLLLRLSQTPKLDYLEICNLLDQPKSFQIVKTQNPTPFQSLERVVLSVSAWTSTERLQLDRLLLIIYQATSDVVSAAAQVFPNVVSLTLNLRDGDGAFLRDLEAVPNLRHLAITGSQATSFPRGGLLALQRLSCLETLTVVNPKWIEAAMVAPQFTDDDLDLIISGMSDLKRLEFDITWVSQSVSVLLSLSKHCRRLEGLNLDGSYDLQALNNTSKVMFPRLLDLTPEDAWIQGVPVRLQAKQIGRLVDNHAPALGTFNLRANYHSHPVTNAWRTLRNLESDDEGSDSDISDD